MKDKTFKLLKDEDKEYRFNTNAFKAAVNHKKADAKLRGTKLTTTKITADLAELTFVSPEAIKNWLYGYNGPTDIESVKKIGVYLGIRYQELLIREEERTKMESNTSVSVNMIDMDKAATRNAVKTIYLAMQKIAQFGEDNFIPLEEIDEAALHDIRKLFDRADQVLKEYLTDIPVKTYKEISEYLWGTMFSYVVNDDSFREEMGNEEETKIQEIYDAAIAAGDTKEDALAKADDVDLFLDYMRYTFYSDMQELFKDFIPVLN